MRRSRFFITIALLYSSVAHSDSLGLNSQPIFYSMVNQNPVYHDAAFKAQEAFLMQTGITPMTDKVTSYVGTSAENKVTTIIGDETPLNPKTVFLLGGTAYAVYVKKQVTQKFRDPFFESVTHTVLINRDSVSTGVQIPLPF